MLLLHCVLYVPADSITIAATFNSNLESLDDVVVPQKRSCTSPRGIRFSKWCTRSIHQHSSEQQPSKHRHNRKHKRKLRQLQNSLRYEFKKPGRLDHWHLSKVWRREPRVPSYSIHTWWLGEAQIFWPLRPQPFVLCRLWNLQKFVQGSCYDNHYRIIYCRMEHDLWRVPGLDEHYAQWNLAWFYYSCIGLAPCAIYSFLSFSWSSSW